MTEAALHWFPGHMAKAIKRLAEDLRFADVVIEVIDARIPRTGANPALAELTGKKPRVIALTRADVADPHATKAWVAHFTQEFGSALSLDAKRRAGLLKLRTALAAVPGKRPIVRAIIVGVPNAGKSTVINALAGRNAAKTENRAGVTRAPQWIRAGAGLELLDTAGILPTRVERPEDQWKLAVVGGVPRSLMEPEAIVHAFVEWSHGRKLREIPDLATFAKRRGFERGGTIDEHNAAWAYLKALDEGSFGRITFDEAPHES